ncbi:unnamed protein product [Acanthoscelides obtectus]|uniref:Uncharacterized protein n=1 Tax=Acanthoscelides obtectus TaxID=200917 RepID=A0A9P0KA62_ACAOB|nr:unnamed protein product [Acanthoscelides obtectus]CAK1680019.1 hypothetical protein AOBTE_LOCUS32491 [Acanthoscelides obtectus]
MYAASMNKYLPYKQYDTGRVFFEDDLVLLLPIEHNVILRRLISNHLATFIWELDKERRHSKLHFSTRL